MSASNDKKIAFIICVSDINKVTECIYYLDRLKAPEGFEKDVLTFQDAPSMAAGYNAGMNSSDAKYKVYLHQDVFIINPNFMIDLLEIFGKDTRIGIVGCIGAAKLGKTAMAVSSWDTGKVIHNCIPMLMEGEKEITNDYAQVQALDGLLLATQYDIPWREDIMDGWDFYDISQCMEFARAGYKAVVPRQKTIWCFHDNKSSDMSNYSYYRQRFIKEYAQDGSFEMSAPWEGTLKYQNMKQQTIEIMEQLIQAGEHEQIHEIFQDPENRKYVHLKEYEIIADVDYLERKAGVCETLRLWQPGMNASEIFTRVQQLKYWIKRIEHQAADTVQTMERVMQVYSVYAVIEIFIKYVVRTEYTYREIAQYYEQGDWTQEAAIWRLIIEQI